MNIFRRYSPTIVFVLGHWLTLVVLFACAGAALAFTFPKSGPLIVTALVVITGVGVALQHSEPLEPEPIHSWMPPVEDYLRNIENATSDTQMHTQDLLKNAFEIRNLLDAIRGDFLALAATLQGQADVTEGLVKLLLSSIPADAWPEGVVARYQTLVGGVVDVTEDDDTPYDCKVTACCSGCDDDRRYYVYDDSPLGYRTGQAKDWAQEHAASCRALPTPAVAPLADGRRS